jgi:hypothetical protein
MSYEYNLTISSSTPVVVTNLEAYTLTSCTLHTIQCSDASTVVEVQIANNTSYINVGTLFDKIENINAYGITAIRLTVSTGTANISIAGLTQ